MFVEPRDEKDLDEIVDDIIMQFSLNMKENFSFKLLISYVIKRERKEDIQQIWSNIGGPGGTGKSQIIKATKAFHKKIQRKRTLEILQILAPL